MSSVKKIPINLRVFMFQQHKCTFCLSQCSLIGPVTVLVSHSVICCIIHIYSYIHLFAAFFLDMVMLMNETITVSQNTESEPVTQWYSIIPQEKKKLKYPSIWNFIISIHFSELFSQNLLYSYHRHSSHLWQNLVIQTKYNMLRLTAEVGLMCSLHQGRLALYLSCSFWCILMLSGLQVASSIEVF
jgi:hypothetical protein